MPLPVASWVVIVVLARLIHASIVKSCSCNAGGFPTTTASPAPSKLNAWLTLPGAYVVLPTRVPTLRPIISRAEPSPCHHATSPAGGVTHVGFVTVRTALELTAKPKAFEMTAEYAPALVLCTSINANVALVAPSRFVPPNRHWYLKGLEPATPTLNVGLAPAGTTWLRGWVLIVGGKLRANAAGALVTAPNAFVITTV